MKAIIFTANQFEESELLVPYYRLLEEGVAVDIVAPASGRIRSKHGYKSEANRATAAVRSEDYDPLIIPGGGTPDALY